MKEIVEYYEICETDYKRFWDLDHSKAMHSGYWDKTTQSLRDALRRENEILAELVGIKPGMAVLDAGCGVGGSAQFLAERGCSVDGITICPYQVKRAREYNDALKNDNAPRFHVMDYIATTFDDASFDVVWAIESVCHATDKEAFVKEAWRVLKPGGRLVVADGFLVRQSRGMEKWLKGWACPGLATTDEFLSFLKKAGFEPEEKLDITKQVMPSSKRLYRIAIGTLWLSRLAEWIGLRTPEQTDNLRAAYWHHKTLKEGDWSYHIILSRRA